jgi:hypothetical protein
VTTVVDLKFADHTSIAAWTSFLAHSGKLLYLTLNFELDSKFFA